jgi:integrase
MSRTINEAALTTPNARRKLASGRTHWRQIDNGVHLGYRRTARAGNWVVRVYLGNGKYQQQPISASDDTLTADGGATLSFAQAEKRARDLVEVRRAEAAAKALGPTITVRQAVEEYVAERNARDERSHPAPETQRHLRFNARNRLSRDVLSLPGLADKPLALLTDKDLTDWRNALKVAPATRQRTASDFRAALNRAARLYRDRLPAELAMVVKHGLRSNGDPVTVARNYSILNDDEVRRIIQAAKEVDAEDGWDGSLFRIVLTLAATGGRFSQAIRMTVADMQGDRRRLMIPASRKGSNGNGKAGRRIPVRVGQDVIDALSPAVIGRAGSEPLFLRPTPQTWTKPGREPWLVSSQLTRPWAKIVKRAGLSATVVPYALRHSSIVRGLRASLPVRLVAALHDTSIVQIERHYAVYISDALDELAARAVVPLAPMESTADVVRLPVRPRSS